MRVALTGASGFIGTEIARQLDAAGHDVCALVRSTSRREGVAPFVREFVVGNQDDESAWPALLDGADCVVHNSVDWAPLKAGDEPMHLKSNLMGSLRFLRAALPRQFIFMSTIAVHHEMLPRWGGVIDEDHPSRPGGLYGAYKAAVEMHLFAARHSEDAKVCALRPCGVYGMDPMVSRTIGHPIVEKIRNKQRFSRAGGGKFVHVEDVAAVACAAVGNDAAHGRVFNLVDCYARWGDLAAMAAEHLGVEADIDLTSPDAPKNNFTKTAVQSLGVPLDRGHDGLREHMGKLVASMSG